MCLLCLYKIINQIHHKYAYIQATNKTNNYNESEKIKKLREEWETFEKEMEMASPIDSVT